MKPKTANIVGNILGAAFALVIISLAVWWQVYRYGDCRNVGHSRLYCVLSIGK